MKTRKFLAFLAFAGLLMTACSNDDDPEPVNEEEVITTMTVTLIPRGGGSNVVLQSQDLDGDGPNAPVVTVSADFAPNTTYDGRIILLNETETPAEDITLEVEEEAEEHQFFYTIGGGLDATTDYSNVDGNGNPLGTEFTLTTGNASAGTIAFTLRHDLNKPNSGLADAGGETDISQTFDVTIQ